MAHFRFRDEGIEVCRLTVSPDSGKKQREVLGLIGSPDFTVTDALRSNCSPEELSEIEHRLSLLTQTEMLQAELAARTLPDQIQSAYVWLSSSERQGELAHLADDIRANWQRLRRTLEQRKLI